MLPRASPTSSRPPDLIYRILILCLDKARDKAKASFSCINLRSHSALVIGLEGALLLTPLDVPEVSNMPMNPVLLERDVSQASSGIRIKEFRRSRWGSGFT